MIGRSNQIAVDTAILPEIENCLDSRDEQEVKAALSFILQEVGQGNFFWLSIPLLLGLLDHRSEEIQFRVAVIFAVMSSQGGADARVDRKLREVSLQSYRDPRLLESVKAYLRNRRLKDSLPPDEGLSQMISDLESDDVEVRKKAAFAIGQAATVERLPPRILPHLMKATRDSNEIVREWTLAAIGSMALRGVPVQDALPDVIRCLYDPSPGAREWAATAVQNLANKGCASNEALPGLISIVEGEDSKPKVWAMQAIIAMSARGIDCRSAIEALHHCQRDEDEEVRLLASECLTHISPARE